jgi:hypothetical protein
MQLARAAMVTCPDKAAGQRAHAALDQRPDCLPTLAAADTGVSVSSSPACCPSLDAAACSLQSGVSSLQQLLQNLMLSVQQEREQLAGEQQAVQQERQLLEDEKSRVQEVRLVVQPHTPTATVTPCCMCGTN